MKNNNDTSREELEAMLKRAVLDGLSNHTGEFANPWIFKGSYSHELLADILNDIMASERLFKNLQNLIDQHTKTMCERARIETLQDFAEYAHTRYKGCTQDEYAYDSEVVIMVDDYVELQSSPNKREDSDE